MSENGIAGLKLKVKVVERYTYHISLFILLPFREWVHLLLFPKKTRPKSGMFQLVLGCQVSVHVVRVCRHPDVRAAPSHSHPAHGRSRHWSQREEPAAALYIFQLVMGGFGNFVFHYVILVLERGLRQSCILSCLTIDEKGGLGNPVSYHFLNLILPIKVYT